MLWWGLLIVECHEPFAFSIKANPNSLPHRPLLIESVDDHAGGVFSDSSSRWLDKNLTLILARSLTPDLHRIFQRELWAVHWILDVSLVVVLSCLSNASLHFLMMNLYEALCRGTAWIYSWSGWLRASRWQDVPLPKLWSLSVITVMHDLHDGCPCLFRPAWICDHCVCVHLMYVDRRAENSPISITHLIIIGTTQSV